MLKLQEKCRNQNKYLLKVGKKKWCCKYGIQYSIKKIAQITCQPIVCSNSLNRLNNKPPKTFRPKITSGVSSQLTFCLGSQWNCKQSFLCPSRISGLRLPLLSSIPRMLPCLVPSFEQKNVQGVCGLQPFPRLSMDICLQLYLEDVLQIKGQNNCNCTICIYHNVDCTYCALQINWNGKINK